MCTTLPIKVMLNKLRRTKKGGLLFYVFIMSACLNLVRLFINDSKRIDKVEGKEQEKQSTIKTSLKANTLQLPDIFNDDLMITNKQTKSQKWSPFELWDTSNITEDFKNFIATTYIQNEQYLNSNINYNDYSEDVTFRYPYYDTSLPKFPTKIDEDKFFAIKVNNESLSSGRSRELLLGVVRVIRGGIAKNSIKCGWPSDLEDFIARDLKKNSGNDYIYDYDVALPVLSPEAYSFQHFMDGAFPKIVQALPFLKIDPNVKLILPQPRDVIIKHIIIKLGLYNQTIWIKAGSSVTSRYQINTCITPPMHPLLWRKMRQLIDVKDERPHAVGKVILLTRVQSHNGGRNILNQQEIIHFLNSTYKEQFHVFKVHESLASYKEFFAGARIIIGVHGGALYNVNFAPKDCHVIEIMPTLTDGTVPGNLAHTIIWRMAVFIGQNYWRLSITKSDQFNNIKLPVDRLKDVLDKIDSHNFN